LDSCRPYKKRTCRKDHHDQEKDDEQLDIMEHSPFFLFTGADTHRESSLYTSIKTHQKDKEKMMC
jgi:hypothetical protein